MAQAITPEKVEHMRRVFTGPLLRLKETLLMMASLTDRNLTMALNALVERDEARAGTVIEEDNVIDKLEVDIDEMVVTYVSTHGPMATACRLALAASKISENLESIADQAVTIARRTRRMETMSDAGAKLDLCRMGQQAVAMMRDSINAFVEVDPDMCPRIVARDREVDQINKQNEQILNEIMAENPDLIPSCVNLMLVSRSIERVADYAKNISQDIYYLYTAQDIRHRDIHELDERSD